MQALLVVVVAGHEKKRMPFTYSLPILQSSLSGQEDKCHLPTPCPSYSPHSLAKKTSVTRVGAGPLTLLEAAARSILVTEGERALAGSEVPLELKTILRYCLPPCASRMISFGAYFDPSYYFATCL